MSIPTCCQPPQACAPRGGGTGPAGRPRGRRVLCCLLALALLGEAPSGWSQGLAPAPPAAGIDPSASLAFADHLFAEGDYYRSITEYRRFLFFAGPAPEADAARRRARRQIARSFYRGRQWHEAAQAFEEISQEPRLSTEERWNAGFLAAVSRFQAGSYRLALRRVQALRQEGTPAQRRQADYFSGWCWLKLRLFDKAVAAWLAARTDEVYGASAAELVRALAEFRRQPKRSASAAGVLGALLPGAGFWYLRRYRDASFAFIVNAGFLVAALAALHGANYALAVLLLLFEAGWYSGNIIASISGAHKENRRRAEHLIAEQETKYGLLLSFGA